jgi:dTDP-4-amino-4,6-dideoxygalactose transaminase
MYARKRLDVGWRDLLSGLLACAGSFDEKGPRERIERGFSSAGSSTSEALACLSVRSGLDLYLEELALPRGSEVLMSALTIPDMWKIVEHHGLVPVPVDLDARTGELLWKIALGGQVNSGPMSYSVNGKQYVTIAAGNSLFAFALRQ